MLFREIFGLRFDDMPKVWRAFHTVSGNHCYHGKAEVVRGKGLLAVFCPPPCWARSYGGSRRLIRERPH